MNIRKPLIVILTSLLIVACVFKNTNNSRSNVQKMNFKNVKKEIADYCNDQLNASNNWNWDDPLPSFIEVPKYTDSYVSGLEEYGGFIEVAIINHITNKKVLLRILSGCEKNITADFESKFHPRDYRYKDHYNKYFGIFDMRAVTRYHYLKTFSPVDLANEFKEISPDLTYCNELDRSVINGYKNYTTDTFTYYEGYMLRVSLRNESESATTIGEREEDISMTPMQKEILSEINTLTSNFVKRKGKIINYKLLDELQDSISNNYRQYNLVYNFNGPFFEGSSLTKDDKKLMQPAITNFKNSFFTCGPSDNYVYVIYIKNKWDKQ